MFIGMSFCLPLGWILDYSERRKKANAPEEERILDAEPLLAVDQVCSQVFGVPHPQAVTQLVADQSDASTARQSHAFDVSRAGS